VSPGSPTPTTSLVVPALNINHSLLGRISDSVVVTDTWAASFSRAPGNPITGSLLHVQLSPQVLTQVPLSTNPTDDGGPFDIAASAQRIILRCEGATLTPANGIVVFDGPTGTHLASFVSEGTQSTAAAPPIAIDAVETNTRKAFLISAGFTSAGFVQQVNY
jgi:hypothetical protein